MKESYFNNTVLEKKESWARNEWGIPKIKKETETEDNDCRVIMAYSKRWSEDWDCKYTLPSGSNRQYACWVSTGAVKGSLLLLFVLVESNWSSENI